ncbi:MAG: MarR family winged helix-turn-helix transcriptional regulator [Gordonia sp. (in: high G+C Gram-positive bacteria)]
MGKDPIRDLEAELADFWRKGRSQMRSRSHAIDPRMDPSLYPLILILSRADSLPMSRLVAELGLDKSTVTRQVDAVVRLGLAERRPDPADARARVVSLTETGRARYLAATERTAGTWRARLTEWDPADVATLAALLHRLTADVTGE